VSGDCSLRPSPEALHAVSVARVEFDATVQAVVVAFDNLDGSDVGYLDRLVSVRVAQRARKDAWHRYLAVLHAAFDAESAS